ncbi:OsmC family peroxiredoxin [Stackebrandtia nassauensis]|uniref:OsmC family protein n=1 Tax=Stackebrandtia nassauensis (strain DSM 44728 / CIP 108903 / NRRL B-16338 / NBRC 102104 / LLR-40K-21) TaxID=446470 RepID=D3Q590_STANL|nr:OsmC family peroxiredoxin [Stackebrandtia nassauensis]ADD44139.1 OsmC family protein [Stackebrandtia nassauensis DSM 44728]
MATVRTARTNWEGDLTGGAGVVHFESSGRPDAEVTWAARSQDANGKTSPEELIAAAHSSCFSMALSAGLAKAGTPPQSLDTSAEVTFDPAAGGITKIRLTVRGDVPGISAEEFNAAAADAKANCPVSKALGAVQDITVDAALK